MSTKYDVPSLYYDEANEYSSLATKVGRTSSGTLSFTSLSSGVTYNSITGENGILSQLQTVLADYLVTASDFNNASEITDTVTSLVYKFVMTNGVLYLQQQ